MSELYKAKEGFIKRSIAGETLLVPFGKTTQEFNGMVVLNETGEFLWELLAQPKSKEELVQAMAGEFSASEAEIRSDVEEFLANGIKDQMIMVQPCE